MAFAEGVTMRRSGRVAEINHERGMVAISTDDDGYTVIEIANGWEVAIGDTMAWEDGYHIGPTIYENLTRASREGVFVRNHSVSEFELSYQLL